MYFKMCFVDVNKCLIQLMLVIMSASSGISLFNNASMTIPLNKTTTLQNKELYGDFVTLNASSTLQINFSNVNESIAFIILQVHCHINNVTLYNNSLTTGSYVTGSNIGLFSSVKPLATFFIYNPNEVDVRIFVNVQGYGTKDPIPGGCNMEFPVPTSPYLTITYNKDYILVNGAPARSSNDPSCVAAPVQVDFYRLYLPAWMFDEDSYFEGLRSMTTLDKIAKNGELIPSSSVWPLRRMFSAYPGTGSVHVAVAYSDTGYSVYVPAHTYACDPLDGCDPLDDTFCQIITASLVFLGSFVCFFGHRYFKTEMFLVGMTTGGLITYIVISNIAQLKLVELLFASLLSGIFFGAIWLLFWWFYGMPVFAVLLATLNLGFLIAAISYNWMPGGLYVLEPDFNFWTAFVFITTLTSVALVTMTLFSNILCCSVLGSYAIIYPIDYYFGSNLKYILINTLRRAIVPKFNLAALSPPFQWRDLVLLLSWLALCAGGAASQARASRGRAPFPPPPRAVRASRASPAAPAAYTSYGAVGPQASGYGMPSAPAVPGSQPRFYTEATSLLA